MSRHKGIPSRYRFRIGQRVEYELPSGQMVGVVAEHLPAGDRVRFKSGIDLTVPVEQLRKVTKGHSCWGPVHCDGECDNPPCGQKHRCQYRETETTADSNPRQCVLSRGHSRREHKLE